MLTIHTTPNGPYLIVLGVVVGLLALGLGAVFLGVRIATKRQWAREQRARALAGNQHTRLDDVLAGLAASKEAGRHPALSDEDPLATGSDVEQARFQVGGPQV
ncbi:hypothetical protein [Xylanimonas protaetiae]|uniref:Uncharacterized protein n=1 Tax=Xylanimonas protaetiae TaxID=2509457 RepID=A0A4P6F6G7_9MICO|nr:hypothetical protein [Xylanimonas protaetiae]QAY71234.1 hypothetical protein ET471_15345 [Xylanimonas protaetiae]